METLSIFNLRFNYSISFNFSLILYLYLYLLQLMRAPCHIRVTTMDMQQPLQPLLPRAT